MLAVSPRWGADISAVSCPPAAPCACPVPHSPVPWGSEPHAAPGGPRLHPTAASGMESVALYNFQATEKDELPFRKGDTLKVPGVWWLGGDGEGT